MAKSHALELYYEATIKGKNNLPQNTHSFSSIAKSTVKNLKAYVTQVSRNELIKLTPTPSTNTKLPALDTAS